MSKQVIQIAPYDRFSTLISNLFKLKEDFTVFNLTVLFLSSIFIVLITVSTQSPGKTTLLNIVTCYFIINCPCCKHDDNDPYPERNGLWCFTPIDQKTFLISFIISIDH